MRFRASCYMFRVPCSTFRVSCSAFRDSCSVFRVSCCVLCVSCFVFRVSCSMFRVVFRVSGQACWKHPARAKSREVGTTLRWWRCDQRLESSRYLALFDAGIRVKFREHLLRLVFRRVFLLLASVRALHNLQTKKSYWIVSGLYLQIVNSTTMSVKSHVEVL